MDTNQVVPGPAPRRARPVGVLSATSDGGNSACTNVTRGVGNLRPFARERPVAMGDVSVFETVLSTCSTPDVVPSRPDVSKITIQISTYFPSDVRPLSCPALRSGLFLCSPRLGMHGL